MNAVLLLVVGSAWAQQDPVPALPPPRTPDAEQRFFVEGYYRSRGHLFYNLDLNRGPTPSTGETIFPLDPDGGELLSSADMRLRVDATCVIVPEVQVHARVDGLDNLVFGSTPQGFPADRWTPMILATTGQETPEAGTNAGSDSLELKRAWGHAQTPFGTFVMGRMGMPMWGLGILANPGDCLDCDVDQDVDRVGFVTTVFDHFVGVSYDWNAVGETSASEEGSTWTQDFDLASGDNVTTTSISVLRHLDEAAVARRVNAGVPAFLYGSYLTWRVQELDDPSYWSEGYDAQDGSLQSDDLETRDFHAVGADAFVKFRSRRFQAGFEAVWFGGRLEDAVPVEGVSSTETVTMNQAAAVLRARYRPGPFIFGMEAGYASGDSAPGFGVAPTLESTTAQAGDLDGPQFSLPDDTTLDNFVFSPNYHVDLILWRQLVGAVTDAVYLRPTLGWLPHERLDVEAAVIHSRAVEATSTPSGDPVMGTELDLTVDWRVWTGLYARLQWGVLFPGAGLRNTEYDLDPDVAQAGRALVAFTF